jgi:DNA-binding SARP family transcriptional activator/TolB-like protein
MLQLHTLGRLEARSDGGSLGTLLAQPKRMALLAHLVLARPRGFRRRDTLVALFWPDLPERRARNALSQALSFLRRELKDDVVTTRGTEDVGIDRARVRCDAIAFEEAVAEERWSRAMALYGGDLLPGLHVAGSAFDQWLEVERSRLRALAAGAAWALAHATLGDGGVAEAERVARRALRLAPTDEGQARSFMEQLARSGGRPAALRFYDTLGELLGRELDIEPSRETRALAERIRSGAVRTAGPDEETDASAAAMSAPAAAPEVPPALVHGASAAEGSPEGVALTRGRGRRGPPTLRSVFSRGSALVALGVLLAASSLLLVDRAPRKPIRLVVLPFTNLTGDSGQEYLGVGLTERTIDELGRLDPDHLAVIAFTSSMHYEGSGASVDRIGAELGVDYILESSLDREGNRLHVDTRLVSVRDQTPIWSDSLDREMAGILQLERDVARSVATALGMKLLPGVRARLTAAPQVDSLAFEAYLEGRFYMFRFTPEDLEEALRYFERAIQYDSSYAPAYAGIAGVWGLRNTLGFMPPDSTSTGLAEAARKALALDSTAAEAHVGMAQLAWTESRWHDAEREIEKALALDPGMSGVRALHSRLLMGLNMPDSAMAEIQKELGMDPFSPGAVATYALDLYSARRFREAIDTLQALVQGSPVGPLPHCLMWHAFTASKLPDEALEEAKICLGSFYGQAVQSAISRGYRAGGYAGAMHRAADLLAKGIAGVYVTPLDPFRAYVYAGRKDLALEWLSRAVAAHQPLLGVATDPLVADELGDDPRYHEILQQAGLAR